MSWPVAVLIALVTAGAALLVDHLVRASIRKKKIAEARDRASSIIDKANADAASVRETAALEGRVQTEAALAKAEEEAAARVAALDAQARDVETRERNLQKRNQFVDEKLKQVETREKNVEKAEKEAVDTKAAAAKALADQRARLEQISGYTSALAKKELMREMETEARMEAASRLQRIEEETRERAADLARWAVVQAIQRYAPGQTGESTVTVVDLPSDEMKGRIIGREGRNIRSIEMATGIDLLIDDTPGAILVSSFNPIRRQIAKIALERLVEDGRIHPARIEEVVAKIKDEFDKLLTETGEAAGFELGLHDLNPKLFKMAGRLNFLTFHGQNLLQHSTEVAILATQIGALLGVKTDVTKRAGFLHKIGFADETNLDRSPLLISAEIAQRLGEPEPVVHCIQALYGIVAPRSMESALLQVAEAVSIARPGARKEMLQTYLERMGGLEDIARSYKGVKEVYAVRAGKEVRVFVEPDRVADKEVVWLSRDIARRIEKEVPHPGQLKVSVIRETRSVDFAM
ncbi:MAG: ribonuclease Y [Acidobacteria bacterium]|nr:ribonuclease Y [Acidobacteriota bacterium]